MNRSMIASLLRGDVPVGTAITLQGWVRTRRDSKAGVSFINVHDGSGFHPIQVVAANTLPNYESEVLRLSSGASVEVEGELVQSQGKGQSVEVQAKRVKVYGFVDDPDTYPISPKQHSFEYLRTVAHLRPRTNTFGAIARVRHTLAQAVHRFFHSRGFLWVHTPIITTSDAEGAGEMFRVSTLDLVNPPRTDKGEVDFSKDFFGRQASLTVSGQLNVEAYALALSNVYTFGPTFRAENSNTTRHLAEFWMVEPEIAFADLNADANLAEEFLKSLFKDLLNERHDDMVFFAERAAKEAQDAVKGKAGAAGQVKEGQDILTRLERFAESAFERMDYTEAIQRLTASGRKFEYPVKWGMDLQTEHERYLVETLVGRPVVVMNYPKDIKAFYMRLNDDGRTVAAMDVLAPGIGEIIGGSQREERLDVLDARMDQMKLPREHYGWYRDLRRYGSVPHAGFGLGFERLIQYATGMGNIRDVIPYPRTPGNADF
jgi:asparaginyl-tRNA synthetase